MLQLKRIIDYVNFFTTNTSKGRDLKLKLVKEIFKSAMNNYLMYASRANVINLKVTKHRLYLRKN